MYASTGNNLDEMTGKSAHACTDFINDEDGSPILDPTVCANTFDNFFTSIHANFRTENISIAKMSTLI